MLARLFLLLNMSKKWKKKTRQIIAGNFFIFSLSRKFKLIQYFDGISHL